MTDAERLARAVLLFYKGGAWTPEDTEHWMKLTGSHNVTTRSLADLARRTVGAIR